MTEKTLTDRDGHEIALRERMINALASAAFNAKELQARLMCDETREYLSPQEIRDALREAKRYERKSTRLCEEVAANAPDHLRPFLFGEGGGGEK